MYHIFVPLFALTLSSMLQPVKFGAEAMTPAADDQAFDEEWVLVKHFKLRLHPSSMKEKLNLPVDGGESALILLRLAQSLDYNRFTTRNLP